MISAQDHFRQKELVRAAQSRERSKWFVAAREHKERQNDLAEEADATVLNLAAVVVLADPIEIEAFKVELVVYDIATIEAIIANREILEVLYAEHQRLLGEAYVLEDGRRVFKSENGRGVFFEDGDLASPDVVDPNEIEDYRPTAEEFFANKKSIVKHEAIGKRLDAYQTDLDEARERADSGEMTKDELDDTRQKLSQDMPIEVRRQLPENIKPTAMALKDQFAIPASDIPSMPVSSNAQQFGFDN